MARKMLIDATHSEETRVVVVNGNKVEEFDFDSSARSLISGNIYLAKVARVEPSLQAAFVDYGGNRHGFLAFSEIHPDYYQIPQADRDALIAEEREARAADEAQEEADEENALREANARSGGKKSRSRRHSRRSKSREAAEAHPEPAISELTEAEAEKETKAGDADDAHSAADEIASSTDDENSQDANAPDEGSDADEADGTDGAEESMRRNIDAEIVETQDDPHEEARPARQLKRARWQNKYKIQEVIKVRQILLVQVAKEERGNKGAALTTYLSLPGRFCVLMPNTARGGGISRKISNMNDRKRLRNLAKGLSLPQGAGLIIRTAGAKQDANEIERDYAFLTRQWNQIRALTLSSVAPATVYHESGPIKRAIRDLLTPDTDEILVEGEEGLAEAKEYMEILMPERVDSVKHYQNKMPLFSRFQVESYLNSMFSPIVQLRSGGYIVIGVTEALVAIDVNSGRSTREASIEETALKTNLEAAEEIARQLKLRDLAGLIVIDFIDMEQRRHQQEVENKLKETLRSDRARIQIGRISGFGLLEMSRQRLRAGLIEAITSPCRHCQGTGIVRSDDSLAVAVIRAIEEEIARGRANEIIAHVSADIANFLFNEKRRNIQEFQDRHGVEVRIIVDPARHNADYKIEKRRVNNRRQDRMAEPVSAASVLEHAKASAENSSQGDLSEPVGEKEGAAKKSGGGRRRTKSRKESGSEQEAAKDASNADSATSEAASKASAKPKRAKRSRKDEAEAIADQPSENTPEDSFTDAKAEDEKPRSRKRARPSKKSDSPELKARDETADEAGSAEIDAIDNSGINGKSAPDAPDIDAEDGQEGQKEKPKTRARSRKKSDEAGEGATKKPAPKPRANSKKKADVAKESKTARDGTDSDEPIAPSSPEPASEELPGEPHIDAEFADSKKPKRRGWWNI